MRELVERNRDVTKQWLRALLFAGVIMLIRPEIGAVMICCLFLYLLLGDKV